MCVGAACKTRFNAKVSQLRVYRGIRVPVRDCHHAFAQPARKSEVWRLTGWRDVHAAYIGVVRERWLATRRGAPRRSAKGTPGDGAQQGRRLPCEDNLHAQICAHSN